MRDAANIKAVEQLDVDWMGFIFYSPSVRDVGKSKPIYLPTRCKRVGVMVSPTISDVLNRQLEYNLDLIQLHGYETPEFCSELKKQLPSVVKLIKIIHISDYKDLTATKDYERVVDYLLFETKSKDYGGSGKQFDWNILCEYHGSLPFLLTGGIGIEDVDKVKSFSHPMFAGVDINSKFEVLPAFKDVDLLRSFIKELKTDK